MSEYIDRAVARMRLGVRADYPEINCGWRVWRYGPFCASWHDTPEDATAAYLALVAQFEAGERSER